ncbi:MAG: beta-ketoacyl-ACP synthase II [Chlamydiia bacterium]|nr:beta-ketoacyl-ACP synthase II [Chlamydiia bacterium]
MNKKRIVVTGMGIVSCFGNNVKEFYQALLAGKSGVGPIKSFDCSSYPTRFGAAVPGYDVGGYIDKKQVRRIDPFIKHAIVAGKKALEMARLDPVTLTEGERKRAGVIIGSGMGGMETFYNGTQDLIYKGLRRLTPFFVPFIITNMAGALLAIDLDFRGPNYSISTACATANYGIISAANHIRLGHADVMLCGGSEAAVNIVGLSGFVANRALSERNEEPTKASRPWDKGRDGFVIGEGAGVLVLESLEHALKRGAPIYAEYLGGSMNCDAFHMTALRDDGSGIFDCIDLALRDAEVLKERVNYVNAHATSTPLGDMVEVEAVRGFFGEHAKNIKMNATKSMTGHCLGAAGGVEAIAVIMAIQTGKLHPTINLDHPEEGLGAIDPVAHKAQEHQVDVALSTSYGFGGHNSCIVLTSYKKSVSI